MIVPGGGGGRGLEEMSGSKLKGSGGGSMIVCDPARQASRILSRLGPPVKLTQHEDSSADKHHKREQDESFLSVWDLQIEE